MAAFPRRREEGQIRIRRAAVLVMQLETPLETVQTAAELAAKAGVPVILNPPRPFVAGCVAAASLHPDAERKRS